MSGESRAGAMDHYTLRNTANHQRTLAKPALLSLQYQLGYSVPLASSFSPQKEDLSVKLSVD